MDISWLKSLFPCRLLEGESERLQPWERISVIFVSLNVDISMSWEAWLRTWLQGNENKNGLVM